MVFNTKKVKIELKINLLCNSTFDYSTYSYRGHFVGFHQIVIPKKLEEKNILSSNHKWGVYH